MDEPSQPRYEPQELLALLAASDEQALRAVLAPTPEFSAAAGTPAMLERRTRVLVRLAALMALNAPTTSLRWAAELALATGLRDEMLAAALAAAAGSAGTAVTSACAPRLATALDLELEPADGA
jgi:hypothetical protein